MKSFVEFNQILVEGRYGSEHGHRKVWNEFRHNKTIRTALGQAVDILNNKNASDKDKLSFFSFISHNAVSIPDKAVNKLP